MTIPALLSGYHRFRSDVWPQQADDFRELVAGGQKPGVAMVTCSDSRVDPAHQFQTGPGDLFVIRSVANLVPPMEQDSAWHGTGAALEYAVKELRVRDIVVLGHAHCGGVQAAMNPDIIERKGYTSVASWVSVLVATAQRVTAAMPDATVEKRQRACEQQAVLLSLENLMTFPWIAERVAAGELGLHGWYFDLVAGELSIHDAATGTFRAATA